MSIKRWIIGGIAAVLLLASAWYTPWLISNPSVVKITRSLDGIAYLQDDPEFMKKVQLKLDGFYHRATDSFEGTLQVGDRVYTNCILTSGVNGIRYEGAKRIVMGDEPVYFDEQLEQLTLSLPLLELPIELEGGKHAKSVTIISAPSLDRTSAEQIRTQLKQIYMDNNLGNSR